MLHVNANPIIYTAVVVEAAARREPHAAQWQEREINVAAVRSARGIGRDLARVRPKLGPGWDVGNPFRWRWAHSLDGHICVVCAEGEQAHGRRDQSCTAYRMRAPPAFGWLYDLYTPSQVK